jgi:hypothetical protein
MLGAPSDRHPLSGEALQICGERDGVDVDLSVEPTAAPLRLAAST